MNERKGLKIAFYSKGMFFGGVEKSIVRLANAFIREDCINDVLLITGSKNGEILGELDERVRHIPIQNDSYISIIFELRKILLYEKPDFLLTAKDFENITGILASFFTKTKVVPSVRTITSREYQKNRSKLVGIRNKLLLKMTFSFVKSIVCISEAVKQDLIEKFSIKAEKLVIIYNPVIDRFEMEQKINEPIDEEWAQSLVDSKFLIAVGRLEREKNYDLMIEAFSIFVKKYDYKLLIVGDGYDRSRIETLISSKSLESKIVLCGSILNPIKFIRKAELFLHTSFYEGFGNVLVEAFATGTPVVMSNVLGGAKEIISESTGLVLKENSVEKYSLLIEEGLIRTWNYNDLILRSADFTVVRTANEYINQIFWK